MPSTKTHLKVRFMAGPSDGMDEASRIIRDGGGTVHKGLITYGGSNPHVLEAIRFLVEEWDFDFVADYGSRSLRKFLKAVFCLTWWELLIVGSLLCIGSWYLFKALSLWLRN